MHRRTPLALAGLLVAVCAFAGARAAPIALAASERCGAPLVAGGQPALVAIVIDGATSREPNQGTSRPLEIPNWCPATPDGAERHMPPGIEDGYRTWAGLTTSERPHTTTCRPEGGLGTDTCLVGRLADAGAVVLPYSYTGARVSASGEFTFTAYESEDTLQEAATSIAHLDAMIASIAKAWPAARVVIVSHSWGGTIASGWWETRAPGRIAPVQHVYALNSPVNGVEQCAATAAVFGPAVAKELCRRWYDRDAYSRKLISLNTPVTFTPIGTLDDPAYEQPVDPATGVKVAAGGRLRAQLLYQCPDDGGDPSSSCIAAPSVVASADPACTASGPGVQGRTGHHVVIGCPATTRTVLAGASPGLVVADGRAGRNRPTVLRVAGLRVSRIRWSAWDGAVARGRGVARGKRRTVLLSRPRPCNALKRFAYTRARVAGRKRVTRRCPARLDVKP